VELSTVHIAIYQHPVLSLLNVPTTTDEVTSVPVPTHSILCGGGPKILKSETGYLQTMHWPFQPYPKNQLCSWTISCPFGIDIYFNKSFRVAGRMPICTKDQLKISGCGLDFGTFCHLKAPPRISTVCSKIDVQFKAGDQRGITRTGFRLNYKCF